MQTSLIHSVLRLQGKEGNFLNGIISSPFSLQSESMMGSSI